MQVINRLKTNVRNRIKRIVENEVENKLSYLIPQLIEFKMSSIAQRQSGRDHTRDPQGNLEFYSKLKTDLVEIGIPVKEIDIDTADFRNWLDDFPGIYDRYQGMNEVHIEKCLEHYLSFRHLGITTKDLYIDIAAKESPWAEILNKKGLQSYRLDLIYEEGIHGINIGANAIHTKLSDNFASALSLQCSYEHFMGDSDVRFLEEANRILNEEGRFTIVPLYLEDIYFNMTSPYINQEDILIDKKAELIWRDDKFPESFSRHYSPEAFKQRILLKIPSGMTVQIFYFRNLSDVMKLYPDQRIYCFFMLYCKKIK